MSLHFYPISTGISSLFEKNNTDKRWIDFAYSLQQKLELQLDIKLTTIQLQSMLYTSINEIYKLDTTQLQIIKDKKESSLPLQKINIYKSPAECKKMNMPQLKEYIIQNLPYIQQEYAEVTEDKIKKMKRDALVQLIQKEKKKIKEKTKEKEEKASTRLAKECNKIDKPSTKVSLVNFKTDKPVDIANDTFWKVKINTFLYIDDEEEEEEEQRFEYHELTGFLFYRTIDTSVTLFGQLVNGNVIKWNQLDEDVILWAQRCGIQIDI